jgi:hypothetical protein
VGWLLAGESTSALVLAITKAPSSHATTSIGGSIGKSVFERTGTFELATLFVQLNRVAALALADSPDGAAADAKPASVHATESECSFNLRRD